MRTSVALLVLMMVAGGVQAQGDSSGGGQTAEKTPAVGERTRALLDMQREGSAATDKGQSLPRAARARALERYLDSFAHPIPRRFERDEFAAD